MTNLFDTLDETTKKLLKRNGFDTLPFESLVASLKRDGVDMSRNLVHGPIMPLTGNDIDRLPTNHAERERISELGRRAIEAGETAVLVLNGGMATRFGSRAKGIAEAVNGRSFLDLKLSQVDVAASGRAEILLMNSFATEDASKEHLQKLSISSPIHHFNQMASIRVTKEGEVFRTENGMPSLHAPGHGDLLYALPLSGELKRFMDKGGKYITVSNVDNLGAGLDPLIIGKHIDAARPMTVEIVPIRPGDTGGFPAVVNNRPVLLEAFRVPKSFDFMKAERFNTNSFVFDVSAFVTEADLSWYTVVKTVEGREAVQFERLIGQLTEFVDVTWLEVERVGSTSRFLPVKTPKDLIDEADRLCAVLTAQGVL
jgi:UTP--glucose-1-phosphate uridylyltransferase